MNKLDPKGCDKAYESLLDYILQFGVGVGHSEGAQYAYAIPMFHKTAVYEKGDLVQVSAMRDPDFRLSWLIDKKEANSYDPEYLLKSAKTGKETWWCNVSLSVMNRDTRTQHLEWKWTNEQYEFAILWNVIQREQDEYIIRTFIESFEEEYVTVCTRTRYSLDKINVKKKFLWNQSKELLLALHLELIKEHINAQERLAKSRQASSDS